MFSNYLELGFDHILDVNGYDHILFVLTLSAVYLIKDWKKILVLVTAFTIGHSITLALAALDIIAIPANIIEVLIPITIILTAMYNILLGSKPSTDSSKVSPLLYSIPLIFGLIHGLGFSYFFKALLSKDESILTPLLPFNLGVELWQIIVVLVGLLLSYIFVNILKIKQTHWNYFISIAAIIISIVLIIDRIS